ncbi:MAG: serine/threonine protein kinase [Proteobacteria bacterium]|nr:serine/threonine protein kinase [Pseudomonadota bacterium]
MSAKIGDYRVIRELGRGSMGVVYEGFHDDLRQRVAIKVLYLDRAGDSDGVARFFDQARAVNIIRHPGIVAIHGLGQLPNGAPYIIMEYSSGQPLSGRLLWCGGRLGPVVLTFARQIASAMVAAHSKGIIHRDLKPDNVIVINDSEMPSGERIKVLDFGIAWYAAELRMSVAPAGTIAGTPAYMPPEQWCGEPVTDKCDVYALGVILYELLAGHLPFQALDLCDLMRLHLETDPAPLREIDEFIPNQLAKLVHAMLSKQAVERPSMTEVANTLNAVKRPYSTKPLLGGPPSPAQQGILDRCAKTKKRSVDRDFH